jgi:hypothetical protein
MLKMRIERAPLAAAENSVILEEYNRLTSAGIPMEEFLRWVNQGPAGGAWHAILESEDGQVVGHTSVFPFRTSFGSGSAVPAKSEYSVLRPEFRKEKVQGYEKSGKPAFILLLDTLFRHCQEQGWGPIFASTNQRNQVFTRKVGLRPVEFPLWECLLVLRPRAASQLTPHITKWQRAGLFSAGIGQKALWSLAPLLSESNGIHEVPIDRNGGGGDASRLAFFEDAESLRWRYLDGQYIRLEFEDSPTDYVIAKRGSATRYLRVCQWRLDRPEQRKGLVNALVRQAKKDKAMGIRWSVYDGEPSSEALVGQMRSRGFLCARRTRIVMIHNANETFLDRSLWKMSDALFSFDP